MGTERSYPSIKFRKRVKYRKQFNDYTLRMKRPRRPWWLLLLLLPLLLIRCNKDIAVTCTEYGSDAPIAGLAVDMSYEARFLWRDGRFFDSERIAMTQTTGADGTTVFRDLPCSVFSYLFYCLSKVSFAAGCECYAAADETRRFHFVRHVNLELQPRREDLHIKLVDDETGDLLPDASVVYKFIEQGREKTDSARADAAGVATLRRMRYCSAIEEITGSCYGYADTTETDVPCRSILQPSDSTALRLRPLKKRFTFFVRNKETRQPIPDASCAVALVHPGASRTVDRRTVRTSIDGKGIAVYDNAFVLSTISIEAGKAHYKDGVLEGGPWRVETFIRQPDAVRTVWLEPEPYLVEFRNVDSLNGRPIAGVRNVMRIRDAAGNEETVVEISNGNGVFPVTAKEGSEIEIVSVKEPAYREKTTRIIGFGEGELIRMSPDRVFLNFQTVEQVAGLPRLPHCRLRVTGSVSGTMEPHDSGPTGEFTVQARVDERLSIVASKNGFGTNSGAVRNEPVSGLQNGRKIPLNPDPVVYEHASPAQGRAKDCYDMKRASGDFLFEWSLCDACTMLVVTDDNGNVLGRFGRNSPGGDGQGPQYSPPRGSAVLHAPTRTVCVTKVNVNGHDCRYKITGR